MRTIFAPNTITTMRLDSMKRYVDVKKKTVVIQNFTESVPFLSDTTRQSVFPNYYLQLGYTLLQEIFFRARTKQSLLHHHIPRRAQSLGKSSPVSALETPTMSYASGQRRATCEGQVGHTRKDRTCSLPEKEHPSMHHQLFLPFTVSGRAPQLRAMRTCNDSRSVL